ncbi:ribosomal protein L6 [Hyphopichia burtonii NRRL Y-1933]|uniref:Ribosomal protein L6 n=1 Tax=Hyphopichia burtonii NRRL Y-1933 TaxID=984485 RepID=A0A1E4RMD9_9ASCO|nr:ribosomal protein L6 [Hyphopichia burtonii NRRL Y-1933]ODV68437.1 ribosomal protein L6 [Hyphopichia burtonii NRRL Y-1933]
MFSRIGFTTTRAFSTSRGLMSNIGKIPVRLTEGVELSTQAIPKEFSKTFRKAKQLVNLDNQITIKGPLGELKINVPSFVKISQENNAVSVAVENEEDRVQREIWGTTRTLIQNHVIGTSEGHLSIVKLVGTGFRAILEDEADGSKSVSLKLGFPYIPKLAIPSELKVTSPAPTRLLIQGADKQQVKLFAARIRELKKPEPYKGKGIYVDDETPKLKEKRTG